MQNIVFIPSHVSLPSHVSVKQEHQCERSGKWSVQEELMASQMIADFEAGLLKDCVNGCTLRSYLARKLNCSTMRIAKKFVGRNFGRVRINTSFQSA